MSEDCDGKGQPGQEWALILLSQRARAERSRKSSMCEGVMQYPRSRVSPRRATQVKEEREVVARSGTGPAPLQSPGPGAEAACSHAIYIFLVSVVLLVVVDGKYSENLR